MNESFDRANEAFVRAADELIAGVTDLATGCKAAIVQFDKLVRIGTTEVLAVGWAEWQHPEWVYISVHHRKRRIRKKYHDRILREYERRNRNG